MPETETFYRVRRKSDGRFAPGRYYSSADAIKAAENQTLVSRVKWEAVQYETREIGVVKQEETPQ